MASLTIMPVKNNVFKSGIHVKTSPFGMRNLDGKPRMHNGIDVVSAVPPSYSYGAYDYVVAFADGVVMATLNTCDGTNPPEGNYITILHDSGEITVYYHLKKGSVVVAPGQKVKKGQTIGYMGKTGGVTGAHLHFGVKINNAWVDPEPYLLGQKEFGKKENPKEDEFMYYNIKLTKDLNPGATGNDVKLLQARIAQISPEFEAEVRGHSINKANGQPDGIWGGGLSKTVKKVQEQAGIEITGILDASTRAVLNSNILELSKKEAELYLYSKQLETKIANAKKALE